MEQTERASSTDAPPTHDLDTNIGVSNTAVEGRRSRAALPPVNVSRLQKKVHRHNFMQQDQVLPPMPIPPPTLSNCLVPAIQVCLSQRSNIINSTPVEVVIADGAKHKGLGQYDVAFADKQLEAPSTNIGRVLITALPVPDAPTIKQEPEN